MALKAKDGQLKPIWKDAEAHAVRSADHRVWFTRGNESLVLSKAKDGSLKPVAAPPAPANTQPTFANLPALVGMPARSCLAADLLGTGKNDLVSFRNGVATLYHLDKQSMKKVGEYPSTATPVIADLNGDGALDLILSDAAPTHQPRIKVVTPSQHDRVVWDVTLPEPNNPTLPKPRPAYLRTVHFTGKKTPDLYAWFATPSVAQRRHRRNDRAHSLETGEFKDIERYDAPTTNLASAFDFNGDGHEDLIYTCPDYYTVASGVDGKPLIGPLYPPKIFSQPSQGLYTLPAILPNDNAATDGCSGGWSLLSRCNVDRRQGGLVQTSDPSARIARWPRDSRNFPMARGSWGSADRMASSVASTSGMGQPAGTSTCKQRAATSSPATSTATGNRISFSARVMASSTR